AGLYALLEIYPRAEAKDRRSTRVGHAVTLQEIQDGKIISENAIAAEYACRRVQSSSACFLKELEVRIRGLQLLSIFAGQFLGPPWDQDATASTVPCGRRCMPLRGPLLRALLTLMHSSSSSGEQVFLASSASAAWIWPS